MSKILIVEDDTDIALLESDYLQKSGFETKIVTDGKKAMEDINSKSFDLVILDIMLPGMNGYEICRELRRMLDIPVLMVTAKTESADKIIGFELGADDYISKPFDPAELVARVKSKIKRYQSLVSKSSANSSEEEKLIFSDVELYRDSRRVVKNGREIRLPNREFLLLQLFFENPDKVFSKKELFEKVWKCKYMDDSATVIVHINRLREKVEDDPQSPKLIETVWGAGYRLNSRF